MNIVDLVFQQADRHALALISESGNLTYGQLQDATEQTVEALVAAGLPQRRPGRTLRIGLACPNGPEYIIMALAVLRAGGCLVPIASELAVPERETLIRSVGVDAVIASGGMPWSPKARNAPSAELPALAFLPGRVSSIFALLTGFPKVAPGIDERALSHLDPAFIRFSSGTTGKAKGIVLSHATLLARIKAGNRRMGIGPDDRVVWILPMAHHFAVSIMLYLLAGAATVIVESHLAEDILTAGRRHGGTVLYGAPFHHALLAAEPSGRSWPSLRLAVSTAAPLPLRTAAAFDDRFCVPLAQGLGIIEIGLPLLNTTAPREKPGSVGRPMPDVEIELRDPESGSPVALGEVGELLIRTEGMLDAYLNPWQLRGSVLAPGGWFRTGDLGQLDCDSYLSLVGRTRTVINVAGMKCFPEEVEAVLQRHPGVLAARVFGRKHQRFGTVPVADIVSKDSRNGPSNATLVEHCRHSLANYKIPVDFRIVTDLPRTPSGKIRR